MRLVSFIFLTIFSGCFISSYRDKCYFVPSVRRADSSGWISYKFKVVGEKNSPCIIEYLSDRMTLDGTVFEKKGITTDFPDCKLLVGALNASEISCI